MLQIYEILKLPPLLSGSRMFSLCKKRLTQTFFKLSAIPAFVLLAAGKEMNLDPHAVEWIQHCMNASFNFEGIVKLKKWEFSVNPEGFVRLRKYYPNGKQEYFSFHLSKLNAMIYLGTVSSGYLVFKTKSDDIIVQTYNDRKGNIDTMATSMTLPVANMEPERLDSLEHFLNGYRN